MFNLRKKIKIDNFISNRKILGLSFVNGRIEIFNTINFEKILKIKSVDFDITKEILSEKQNYKKEIYSNSNANFISHNSSNNFHHSNSNALKINYVKDKNQVKSKLSDTSIANSLNKQSGPLFDLTEDYIIFYNYKNKYTVHPSKKVSVNRKSKFILNFSLKSKTGKAAMQRGNRVPPRKTRSKAAIENTPKKRKQALKSAKKSFLKSKTFPIKNRIAYANHKASGNGTHLRVITIVI